MVSGRKSSIRPIDRSRTVVVDAAAVRQAEHLVLVDAEPGEAGAQLLAAQPAEPVGRPAIRIAGAVLAGGGGHDDDPVATAAGLGHQPR